MADCFASGSGFVSRVEHKPQSISYATTYDLRYDYARKCTEYGQPYSTAFERSLSMTTVELKSALRCMEKPNA